MYERSVEYDDSGKVRVVSEKEFSLKKQSDEPEYIKFYVKMVSALRDIPMASNSLITQLLIRMSYADEAQRVILNGDEIETICKKAKISRSSFERQMQALIKRGVIHSKRPQKSGRNSYTGTFFINPHFFAKGDWKNVKQLRSYIRLDAKGGQLLTEMSNEEPTNSVDIAEIKANSGQQELLFERGEWLWELDRFENQLPPSENKKTIDTRTLEATTDETIDFVRKQDKQRQTQRGEDKKPLTPPPSGKPQTETQGKADIIRVDNLTFRMLGFIKNLPVDIRTIGGTWKGDKGSKYPVFSSIENANIFETECKKSGLVVKRG